MSPLGFNILRSLQDGGNLSCNELAQLLSVSSAKILQSIIDIKHHGLPIIEINGRGYSWDKTFQWLDTEKILSNLGHCFYRFDIDVSDCIESTNTYFITLADTAPLPDNTIQVKAAELQTIGRGRNGKVWFSELGNSLTFSLLWKFNNNISYLQAFSLVIGVALLRSLRSLGFTGLSLKWPNDILHSQKKLAGILIEVKNATATSCSVIIGIGINIVINPSTQAIVQQEITDLYSITKIAIDRNQILSTFLTELSAVLVAFERSGFASFRSEWIDSHAFEGKQVELHMPNYTCYHGTVAGIDNDGSLILIDNTTGIRRKFSAGEFSLR